MIEVQANQRLLLLISESKGVGTGWKSHQRDQDKYLPFCAYIGGNTKEELKSVVADLDCSKVQIRVVIR